MKNKASLIHHSSFRLHRFFSMPAALAQYVPQVAPTRVGARVWLVWGACVVLMSAWLSLILGAPLLRAHGHEALALLAYRVFAALCHQIPERSFYLAGQPLAVCARCFGIYAGFALGV